MDYIIDYTIYIFHIFPSRPVVEKPYLGGFRNKESGATYHHAVTQTAPLQKKEIRAIRLHRIRPLG